MKQRFEKINSLKGELILAGDKSISHRSVMFACMADGESRISNCSESEDVTSTINCFQSLGCKVLRDKNDLIIHGKGFKNFTAPTNPLDAGNSGTTSRLISGILCAQNFESTIIGDSSLSKRPMKRIVEPLKAIGANLETSEEGTLPLKIYPSDQLKSFSTRVKVASAQVKSALILCAVHMDEESEIIEPVATRNHTEVMLGLRTVPFEGGSKIFASKKNYPKPLNFVVPSDISSAAFFIVAALLIPNSDIVITNVSLNPTRTGILKVLQMMGANIFVIDERVVNGETVGSLRVVSSKLKNVEIPKELIPNIIDEIPILSVAGIFAEGKFRISNAEELRVKESDRIKALCDNYVKTGLAINEFEDGFEIDGVINEKEFTFESYGDHRIAMAFGILSSLLSNGGIVNEFECVGISNPNFLDQIKTLAV